MKIIFVDASHGASRSITVKGWTRLALSLCLLGLPMLIGYGAYLVAEARGTKVSRDETAESWIESLREQQADLAKVKTDAYSRLEALTIRLANLQARLVRLDALGEKLSGVAGLPAKDFNFKNDPSLGGPEAQDETKLTDPDLQNEIEALEKRIAQRQRQLELLNSVMTERHSLAEFDVSGRPIIGGYISSEYGRRLDPFTGNLAVHQGVDFNTGRVGEDVFALAAGVVNFSGTKDGFGQLVQIDHGNGYETLYAHDQKLLVKEGDVVKKGQVIALSGTSGRSTGPHVHFEVHKNGRVVDPAAYIHSTIR
jgi:murein DD-endopeptidase MepM/ murein hydrolase activator NlpD